MLRKDVKDVSCNVEKAARIFEEYGDFIHAVVHYRLKDENEADDILQDLFLSLVARPMSENVRDVKSYLYRAVVNDINDSIRRIRRYRTTIGKYAENFNYFVNNHSLRDALVEKEERNKIFKLIEELLPPREARAVTLRYKNDDETRSIAEKMGVKDRSVTKFISRGISKLRLLLKKEPFI